MGYISSASYSVAKADGVYKILFCFFCDSNSHYKKKKNKKICITLIVKGETKTAQASTRSYAVLAEGDASTTHLVNGTRFSVYTAICVSAASYYLFKRMLFFSE